MKQSLTVLTIAAVLCSPIYAAPAKVAASAVAVSASAPVAPVAPVQLSAPEIAATAYLVQDLRSGQILISKNPDGKIEPASLTKLMTAYLTFKALNEGKLKPDQLLTVSEHGWKAEGSRMFLERNKPAKVSELIMGLIVQSGNDAAITLAEGVAGSEAEFAKMMNAQAAALGMSSTHFDNSTGLPADTHLTTVRDLAVLSAAIIRDYPEYYKIYSEKSFTYNGITQPNRNLLLFRDPSVDGLKTGHTNSAGYNLIASSKRNGRRVISVVVGTASAEARATESSKLLNFALTQFDTPKMYTANQEVAKVKLYKGAQKEVSIGFDHDAYITIPKGLTDVKPVLETQQPVLAPVKKGQQMGVLKLMQGDKVLSEQKVVALQDVEQAGFFGRAWDSIVLWFKTMFAD
ncbi:D-alanyl-D-alanine carboxypeptidase family protein [Neisseriaceae bacterium B1]